MIEEIFTRKEVIDLLKKNNVAMLGLFGSYARGEQTETSDIDFVIRFSQSNGLLALIRLKRELSEILGKKVDLVTERSISPYIRKNIMDDLKVIYNAN
ncbi:MAG TPA: nucleotidyltransferase family protein [bacterium]|nr:nucleotidyltransferase family protein [bacterium]HPN45964.1 nucleotidyltransferase family protein [bacterium]